MDTMPAKLLWLLGLLTVWGVLHGPAHATEAVAREPLSAQLRALQADPTVGILPSYR